MEHRCEDNIKCPYCDHEDLDSWEFGIDSGTHTCGSCEEEFNVEPCITVTYNTSRINCEETGTEHDYQFESVFESKRKYEKGIWSNLLESEWTYTKIMMCSICGEKTYSKITKEEFLQFDKTNRF